MIRNAAVLAWIPFFVASVGCKTMSPAPEDDVKLVAVGDYSRVGPAIDPVLGTNGTEKAAYLRIRERNGLLVAQVFEKPAPAGEAGSQDQNMKPARQPDEKALFELDLPKNALAMSENLRGPLETKQEDADTLEVSQKGEALTPGFDPDGPAAEEAQATRGQLRVLGERHVKYGNGYLEHWVSGSVAVELLDSKGVVVGRFEGITSRKEIVPVYSATEALGEIVGDPALGGGERARFTVAIPKGKGTITMGYRRLLYTFDPERDVLDPRGGMEITKDSSGWVVAHDRFYGGFLMNGIDLVYSGEGKGEGRIDYDLTVSITPQSILLLGRTRIDGDLVAGERKASFAAEKAVNTALEW